MFHRTHLIAAFLVVVAGPALAPDASPGAGLEIVFPRDFVPEQRRAQGEAPGETLKITDGYFVESGRFRWQAGLIDGSAAAGDEYYVQFCGGSLLAPEWVLTAAHCLQADNGLGFVETLSPGEVDVVFGSVFLDRARRAQVAEVIVHEDYDPATTNNDIALLRLASPVAGEVAEVIALPGSQGRNRSTPPAGTEVTASGWGRTETGEFPVQLKAVDIVLTETALCNHNILTAQLDEYGRDLQMMLARLGVPEERRLRIFDELRGGTVVTEAMICAGLPQGGRDSCQGDSGGPLFRRLDDGGHEQVGIVSWGISCGEPELYGVYTDVAYFVDWIRDRMR